MRLVSRPISQLAFARPAPPPSWRPSNHRPFHSDRTVQENDVILLRQRGDRRARWRVTPPLRPGEGKKIKLHYGATVDHDDLVGRRMLDRLKDSTGRDVVVHEASMATHITHSARRAVPIYPHDAATIVSMLDLHPERPGEVDGDDDGEPFEVFEAGTGAGSLTLHIARALHAANPPVPRELRDAMPTAGVVRGRHGDEDIDMSRLDLPPHLAASAASYLGSRRAVLHTLDHKAAHSRAAHDAIRRFRRAMYLPNVDFHVGSVAGYLGSRLGSRPGGRPFLSRAVLDLPSPEDHAEPLVRALRPNATLVAFSPSISQVAALVAWSVGAGQPLNLDRVAELPTSSSAEFGVSESEGGRAWNLKTVVPKEGPGDPVQVMRPKVGDRVAGGGFVAVLRKVPADEVDDRQAEEEEEDDEEEDGRGGV